MIERPTEVLTGPTRYRVLWDLGEVNKARHVDGETSLGGTISYRHEIIRLDGGVSEGYARRVLLHEILHAIIESVGGLGIPSDVMREDQVVDRLEAGLLDVLRRNPAVVAWLTAEEDTP